MKKSRITDVECPYCGDAQDICHDDGQGYEEGETHQQECGECEKIFTYQTMIRFNYSVAKAACLNGGEHDWKACSGTRHAGWLEAKRCHLCDEEVRGPFTMPDYMKENAKEAAQ